MFVLFKSFCYSYFKENDFSLKLPHFELIRNSAFAFEADLNVKKISLQFLISQFLRSGDTL